MNALDALIWDQLYKKNLNESLSIGALTLSSMKDSRSEDLCCIFSDISALSLSSENVARCFSCSHVGKKLMY